MRVGRPNSQSWKTSGRDRMTQRAYVTT